MQYHVYYCSQVGVGLLGGPLGEAEEDVELGK